MIFHSFKRLVYIRLKAEVLPQKNFTECARLTRLLSCGRSFSSFLGGKTAFGWAFTEFIVKLFTHKRGARGSRL
jgi:hypothetical protein